MQNEKRLRRIFTFSVALALILSFVLGFQVAGLTRVLVDQNLLPKAVSKVVAGLSFGLKAGPQGINPQDLKVFYETLAFISQTFLNRATMNEQSVIEGAASGAVQALGDRYSRFVAPAAQKALSEEIEGKYAGIGVSIIDRPNVLPPWPTDCELAAGGDKKDPKFMRELKGVVIVQAFESGPAFDVGIKADDVVLCVDGHDLRGAVADDAVALIKGAPDTVVKITIWRSSIQKEFSFDVTRRVVQVPTVGKKEMLTDTIGYIRLDTFNNLSPLDVQGAIDELTAKGMKGLIFDLRNNTGGPLTAAVGIADEFIAGGNLVYYEDSTGQREPFPSEDGGKALNMPLVILTNGNTASASEIVAGAVRDTHMGLLVGENTYGKGVVQNVYNLSDGSGLVLTTGRYLTPGLHQITQDGLTPDVLSKLDPEQLRTSDPKIGNFLDRMDSINKEYLSLRQEMTDYLTSHDFQRDTALDVIKKWMDTGTMPEPEPVQTSAGVANEVN